MFFLYRQAESLVVTHKNLTGLTFNCIRREAEGFCLRFHLARQLALRTNCVCVCLQYCGRLFTTGARHSAVGWGTALQVGRSRVRFPMASLEFFIDNLPGRTVALGSTQSLTEMSTTNIFLGCKGGRYVGLTTLPPSYADCLEIWEPQPPGTFRACPGL